MTVSKLAPFRTIDDDEVARAASAINHGPLSGFIASKEEGGKYVSMLEAIWMARLGVKHAISFNSATSALLGAAVACGIERGVEFLVSPYTMSATAAAPKFLGGTPTFCDIEKDTYCIDPESVTRHINSRSRAIFATNLFGHCAHLSELRAIADQSQLFLIEDASQSPMATENGRLAGTIGHIGVFSLNVHKHIQCGEGGIAVTDDDSLAFRMRCVRNHGENLPDGILGLNLRMTEPIAAIACAQMDKLDAILADRIKLATTLTKKLAGISGVQLPFPRPNCRHVYYSWPILLEKHNRDKFIKDMQALGVPLSPYVMPLYYLNAFREDWNLLPNTEEVCRKLCLFEICTYAPTELQVHQMAKDLRCILTI